MNRNTARVHESVHARLAQLIDALAAEHAVIHEAVRYTVLSGGKRLRPTLCLLAHDVVGGKRPGAALDAAAAIECVHTYSLVHDDLPCMDDDDMRRGQPSCHRRFDEATAVLTGDALLTLAFDILSSIPERHGDCPDGAALAAIQALSRAAGTGGLITGQALDLAGHTGARDLDDVLRIHENKTGRLFAAALEIGGIIGDAAPGARQALRDAGLSAGAAFQIIDDVLDLETDQETLGKTPGKDVQEDKLTYPSVVGPERARSDAQALIAKAIDLLPTGPAASIEALTAVFASFATRSG